MNLQWENQSKYLMKWTEKKSYRLNRIDSRIASRCVMVTEVDDFLMGCNMRSLHGPTVLKFENEFEERKLLSYQSHNFHKF